MTGIFGNILDGAVWFVATGWKIWTSLFAPFPFGDPYLAIAGAMVVVIIALKVVTPSTSNY